MWVTTHQGNQPWVLGSTWGLKWHFHSHLSWMILAVSDRNYCFVSSRILSLHLAFSINGKTFYFFKDKPLDVTFLNFLPLNIHSCLCLVCHFLSPFPKKKKKKKPHFFLSESDLQIYGQDCTHLIFSKEIPSLIMSSLTSLFLCLPFYQPLNMKATRKLSINHMRLLISTQFSSPLLSQIS